jgi:FkbM family methyltransferase
MLIKLDYLLEKYQFKPTGVLHVGANIGEESEAYQKAGIKRVVWIEANPDIFEILKRNIKDLPENEAFNICAGDEQKDVILHESNNAGQSSSILELGTHKRNHPTVHYVRDIPVKMFRLEDFLGNIDMTGINFLSVDIQGAELLALKGMGKLLEQFNWVYLEVNKEYVYKGNALVGEVDMYLKGFGFKPKEEKWTGAKWGDKFYSK